MNKLVSAIVLGACLCAASAAWAATASPTGSATVSAGTVATSTGTVAVTTPGVTAILTGGGKSVTVASGSPKTVATGTYGVIMLTYTQATEKDGKKESWSLTSLTSAQGAVTIKVTEGAVTPLGYGPPLVAKVECGTATTSSGTTLLPIDLVMKGRAGEPWHRIAKDGKLPEKVGFTILDEKGKQLGQGNFEYG
jgi:hypothetical protein